MLNLNFDGARPECIDAEHHATASTTASDGPQPARFRLVSYEYDVVLTDELLPGRGEDGHHYRDDELYQALATPLYTNGRQRQLQTASHNMSLTKGRLQALASSLLFNCFSSLRLWQAHALPCCDVWSVLNNRTGVQPS